MIDLQTQAVLQGVLRRESRSLLQYLDESFPWTTPDKQDLVGLLHRLAAEQRQEAAAVAEFLIRRRAPLPYLGSFPEEFTSVNFIGLDYALARLARDEQRALERLEGERDQLADPEARELVERLIGLKRRHLKELEGQAGAVPATTLR